MERSRNTNTMCMPIGLLWFVVAFAQILPATVEGNTGAKVRCTESTMMASIILPDVQPVETPTQVYLEGLKGYPNSKCMPFVSGNTAEFSLSLQDFYECGVTRIINQMTGKKVYYHKVIVETTDEKKNFTVKCETMDAPARHRRDLLPPGFEEPLDLEITTSLIGNAPEPILGVAVRQNGEIVDGELNVSPGTPLSMEIYLDKASSPVYGLGVTYMQVSDTKHQEETIIFNGCSVDPYLFDNFNTVDGDHLNAKFRAFKFPESSYVQFRGTVSVCVDNCSGVQCSNGQTGYGRRRRSVDGSKDSKPVYEMSMSTFIKVINDSSNSTGGQFTLKPSS